MRDLKKLMDFTAGWEGGLSKDKNDSASNYPNPLPHKGQTGWHTNKGITFRVWEKNFPDDPEGFFVMAEDKWFHIFKKGYWDKVKADLIDSFAVAVYTFGIAWGSGPVRAKKTLQSAVSAICEPLLVDGIIGSKTLAAVNKCDEVELFDKLLEMREAFFRKICTPEGSSNWEKNKTFLNGWLNRLEDYRETFRPEE